MDSTGLMITVATIIASISGAWAVVQRKTNDHDKAIEEAENDLAAATVEIQQVRADYLEEIVKLKADYDKQISTINVNIAVLQSNAKEADRRLSEGLNAIKETVSGSETRILAHVDALIKVVMSKP